MSKTLIILGGLLFVAIVGVTATALTGVSSEPEAYPVVQVDPHALHLAVDTKTLPTAVVDKLY